MPDVETGTKSCLDHSASHCHSNSCYIYQVLSREKRKEGVVLDLLGNL